MILELKYDDYLPWLLFLLQESSKIGFNVLSFSNILYLIETYTFSQLKLKNMRRFKKARGTNNPFVNRILLYLRGRQFAVDHVYCSLKTTCYLIGQPPFEKLADEIL